MDFSQNEPISNPGLGRIRTMQGDLKNIRASRIKTPPKTEPKPAPLPQQIKPGVETPNQTPFSIPDRPIAENIRPAAKNQTDEQTTNTGAFELFKKPPVEVEKEIEKPKQAPFPNPAKSIAENNKKFIEKKESAALKEIKKTDEAIAAENDADKIQEKIKQLRDKIKPFVIRKDVAAPDNLIKVLEPENKIAAQYAASLSKSTEEADSEKREKPTAGDEQEEYLPPELRLYRNTGNSLSGLKKNAVTKKLAEETNKKTQPAQKTASSAFAGAGNKPKIKFALLTIMILLIGGYLVLNDKIDTSFLFRLFEPKITPPIIAPPPKNIGLSNKINLKNPANLNAELFNLKEKAGASISLISIETNSGIMAGNEILNKLNIALPENLKNLLNADNSYLLYFAEDNRLGLALEIKKNDKDLIRQEMNNWGNIQSGSGINPIAYTLSPLLLGNFFELENQITFKNGNYKNTEIYYANLPDPSRAIDYAVLNDFIVIATSKNDISKLIDELVK